MMDESFVPDEFKWMLDHVIHSPGLGTIRRAGFFGSLDKGDQVLILETPESVAYATADLSSRIEFPRKDEARV